MRHRRSVVVSQKSPEMLHVWFVDHPDGRFASGMSLPEEVLRRLGNPETIDDLPKRDLN